MTAFVLFWMVGAAGATPVGDPVANPSTGRIHLDAGLVMSQYREVDSKCSGNACYATTIRKGIGLELGAAVVRGFGLYARASRQSDTVREAHYEGTVNTLGGGVRFAVPIRPLVWLSSTTDVHRGDSESKQAQRVDDPAQASETMASTTLLAVLGDPDNGGHLWLGAQGAWYWDHSLQPLGSQGTTVNIPLDSRHPLSVVVGGTVISDGIGAIWRTGPRLRVSIEGRAGQEMGLHVATGVAL